MNKVFVDRVCSYLPAIGILTSLLPDVDKHCSTSPNHGGSART